MNEGNAAGNGMEWRSGMKWNARMNGNVIWVAAFIYIPLLNKFISAPQVKNMKRGKRERETKPPTYNPLLALRIRFRASLPAPFINFHSSINSLALACRHSAIISFNFISWNNFFIACSLRFIALFRCVGASLHSAIRSLNLLIVSGSKRSKMQANLIWVITLLAAFTPLCFLLKLTWLRRNNEEFMQWNENSWSDLLSFNWNSACASLPEFHFIALNFYNWISSVRAPAAASASPAPLAIEFHSFHFFHSFNSAFRSAVACFHSINHAMKCNAIKVLKLNEIEYACGN